MKTKKLINNKLFLVSIALIPIVLFGFLTYHNLKAKNKIDSTNYIQNINQETNQNIINYFNKIEFDIKNLEQTVGFLRKQTKNNITNLQEMQKKHILDYYKSVDKNLLALSRKDIFQYIYSFKNRGKEVLPQYLNDLKLYGNTIEIPNILMINTQGKVVYSSLEKRIQNKNVQNFNSTFKKVWKNIRKYKYQKRILYVQVAYNKYTKHYEQYAITRFKDVNGYVAIKLNLKHLEKDIKNVRSLGSSAETYLTYKQADKTYLALDRHVKNGKQGDEKMNPYVNLGFKTTGVELKKGSTGAIELVGYIPIKIRNISYSMQTTVPYIDIISPSIHKKNYFEHFIEGYGYQNIALVASNGDVFYSIEKDDGLGTNIFTGKYSKSIFAQTIKEALQTKKFILTDKHSFEACTADTSQYAIMPSLNEKGDVEIIIVLELSPDKLEQRLHLTTSIYKTLTTFLNKDLQKEQEEFISAESTIDFSNVHWKLSTQVNTQETLENLQSLKYNIYLFLFISSFITIISIYFLMRERKKNDKKLTHQVMHDDLTKLPNRKYALDFLSHAITNATRNKTKGAVLFLDLDKFKIINDTYGHKAGDKVLIEVANRFTKIIRESDLVARIGGDEFLIILNDYKGLHNIDTVCKKLLSSLRNEIEDIDENTSYAVGLSIGVATFPDDSNNPTELLTFADTAMYATKDTGRNNYTYYDQEMMKKSRKEAKLEEEMHHAIAHDELVLHYQPQVQLSDLKVIGVEALVRWNHPQNGFVMPNDFIPIAENSNLIIDLGYWVLKQACIDFKDWKSQAYDLEYVAVNMSAKQLESTDCVSRVLSILETLDFNPKNLELEITETTLISNFENTIANINTFKSHGIKFSIDDFGTGYSSLSYLKSLHISTLKIDRVFVKDILKDRDDRTIVSAIIAMGHALGYTIIAEGAEEKAEIELLRYLACDTIQGYYFSKPLPAQKLLEFIDKGIDD
jgi:diguanylate cyclase (GGDEF)-like protein